MEMDFAAGVLTSYPRSGRLSSDFPDWIVCISGRPMLSPEFFSAVVLAIDVQMVMSLDLK
jgi:hypothetical protein